MTIETGTMIYQNRPLPVPRAPAGAKDAKGIDRSSDLYSQCSEFESIFINMMLKEMRKTVEKDGGLVDGGYAEDIFQDMLYDEYSRNMAKTGSFGLADQVYLQLTGGR